jgi:hypothetical protein
MSTLTLAFSPETKAVSTYSNHDFIGSHRFKGKTVFITSATLFESGGTTDAGTAITPSLKTGLMCEIAGQNGLIRSKHIKRIKEARIDVNAKTDGKIKVTVTADDTTYTPYVHDHAATGTNFRTHSVKIGRGIKYNAIQIKVEATNATSLDIDTISFNPTELVKKERG